MTRDELYAQWSPYRHLIKPALVEQRTDLPRRILGEEVNVLLPSIVLGTDGPAVSSLWLGSASVLIEIRLETDRESFDYVSLKSIVNLRFDLWEEEVTAADGRIVKYEIAKVDLRHLSSGVFKSE